MSDQKLYRWSSHSRGVQWLGKGVGGGKEVGEGRGVKVEICIETVVGEGMITLRELQQEQTVRLPAVFWRHWWQVRPPILSYTRSPFAS